MPKPSILFAVLALSAACAGSVTNADLSRNDQLVTVEGPLRMDVEDFATSGGILWALPSVTGSSAGIGVSNTQYGSLCRFALSGAAQVSGRAVTLRVKFNERLTSCTAEIRALRYNATISVGSGTYDVTVIHDYNNVPDTLAKRTVSVP